MKEMGLMAVALELKAVGECGICAKQKPRGSEDRQALLGGPRASRASKLQNSNFLKGIPTVSGFKASR